MATARDAADIFGLTTNGQPRPKKKKIEPTPRNPQMPRELQMLMGDSVPPINIVEQKQYKAKIPTKFKTRHWEMRDFLHSGRGDGLVLKHWKRAVPSTRPPVGTPDAEMEEAPVEIRFEDEFPSDKWNVKVEVPSYTDEQYETSFKSEEWSREETDYLLDLCRDFDLRWALIADRYEPPGDHHPRTMEAMKLRYYNISAKIMESVHPPPTMTTAEFQLWEKMRNFDAKTETLRKSMAEKLFERSREEADEERILLEELHRISKHEEEFIQLRRDLYSRLESAPPSRRNERGEEQSTAMYHTSAGLTALLQSLLSRERRNKRPLTNGEPQPTPVDQRRGQPNQYSRRDTMDSQTDGPQKKGSTSQPTVRRLSPAEEVKFGVSHPQEKLTSGVQFRHQKIDRLTMAKSAVQTSKIQAALVQLGIPPRLLMPTERVCKEFERLIDAINTLLDARKMTEKQISETKVLEEMRRRRLRLPEPGQEAAGDAMEVETSQIADGNAVNESRFVDDQDAEGEDEDAEGEKDEDESAMQVDQEDDDEEDADDAGEKSAVAEDDDEDVDQSYADLGKDDDEEEEQEEQDDEGPAMGQESEAEDEDDDDAAPEADADEDDEAEVNESEAADESEENEDEAEEDDDEGEAEEEEPKPSRSSSSHSAARAHKRSASVISDVSKTGSNRSGLGRKKRR